MRKSTVVMLLGVGLLIAAPISAQDNIISKGTGGVRERAGFENRTGIRAAAMGDKTFNLLLSPAAVFAEDVTVFGATAGFINGTAITSIPFQLRVGYRRLEIEDADGLNRVNANLKAPLLSRTVMGRETNLTAIGDYTRTFDTSKRMEVGAAFEHALITGKLAFGVNGAYVKTEGDGGGSVDGLVPSAGLVWTPSERLEIDADYSFDNDVDGDDGYSANFVYRLSPPVRVIAGYAKENTFFVTLVFVR